MPVTNVFGKNKNNHLITKRDKSYVVVIGSPWAAGWTSEPTVFKIWIYKQVYFYLWNFLTLTFVSMEASGLNMTIILNCDLLVMKMENEEEKVNISEFYLTSFLINIRGHF